jgi:hypothetical protein
MASSKARRLVENSTAVSTSCCSMRFVIGRGSVADRTCSKESAAGDSVCRASSAGWGCRHAAGGAYGLAGQSVHGEAGATRGAGRRREPFCALASRYPAVAVGTHTVTRTRSPFLHPVQVYECRIPCAWRG